MSFINQVLIMMEQALDIKTQKDEITEGLESHIRGQIKSFKLYRPTTSKIMKEITENIYEEDLNNQIWGITEDEL